MQEVIENSNYEVIVLYEGYSRSTVGGTLAGCTCTLIKGFKNIIVDTLTAWDGQKLINALKLHDLRCEDIDYVVCTHGHADHIGCNYLFLSATHIVGYSISHQNTFMDFDFNKSPEYKIDDNVKVVATPGHTLQDVSVVVRTSNKGIVVIAGDLFENENDLTDDNIWKEAGSDSEELQIKNREKMFNLANWIVPGHGPMFQVKKSISSFSSNKLSCS